MSGALIETKKKIGSLKNTKKITKAMELVAASKMKFFQKKAVNSRTFALDLLNILKDNLTPETHNMFTETREEGATLFVLFTSDKGLCGALNNRLIKTLFQSNQWIKTPEEERLLVTIGKKGNSYARFNQIPVAESFSALKEAMTPISALDVIQEILKFWTEKKVRRIMMVSPHYKNAFTYYPILKTFLPFSLKNIEHHLGPEEEKEKSVAEVGEPKNDYMLFEPGREEVINHLTEELVITIFIQAFFELKATEYSSRMIAMKSATDSADKIIDDLTLDLNKARQQLITTELADLINSSEAIQAG